MAIPTITIDMNEQCPRCGKMGMPCLTCALKLLSHRKERDPMMTRGILKTITTSRSEEGVFAKVVIEFGVNSPQAKEVVTSLVELQEKVVEWSVHEMPKVSTEESGG